MNGLGHALRALESTVGSNLLLSRSRIGIQPFRDAGLIAGFADLQMRCRLHTFGRIPPAYTSFQDAGLIPGRLLKWIQMPDASGRPTCCCVEYY